MPWALREFMIRGHDGPFTAADAAVAAVQGTLVEGDYVAWCDVDAMNGVGACGFCSKPENAMTFESQEAAWMAWKAQSTVRPTRADGQPNRPLTAISVTMVKVGE